MLLTPAEVESLTGLRHGSPHSLLGLHPLGDGTGMVGRAHLPGAQEVEIVPVHEKTVPVLKLKRVGDTDLFEGVTRGAKRV